MPESDTFDEYLYRASDEKRRSIYGDEVYIIGLIEFTNYCRNNCYYCEMRIFIIRIHFYFVIICSSTQTLTPLLQEPHRMPVADAVDEVLLLPYKNCEQLLPRSEFLHSASAHIERSVPDSDDSNQS